jgi:SAM-dependent methyltransferase
MARRPTTDLFARLAALQKAAAAPDYWREFPWDDPRISPRLLAVHLDPTTEQASRPRHQINAHCEFLDRLLRHPRRAPARVCDLTCGPGLYSLSLAERGHDVVGIDYAPAVIEHARKLAPRSPASVSFVQADAREIDFPAARFEAVLCLYAQPNSFTTEALRRVLRRVRNWVTADGLLVLEFASRAELHEDLGRSWELKERSFLHDGPHLWLEERRFVRESSRQVHQLYVIDPHGRLIADYGVCMMAYEPPEVEMLLRETGWRLEVLFGDLLGNPYRDSQSRWLVAVARPAAEDGAE